MPALAAALTEVEAEVEGGADVGPGSLQLACTCMCCCLVVADGSALCCVWGVVAVEYSWATPRVMRDCWPPST